MEHALRTWLIAARLSERAGVEGATRASLYFVTTLAWVGCVADTPEVAKWFGDDIAFRRDSFDVDRAGLPMLGFALRHLDERQSPLARARSAVELVMTGGRGIQEGIVSHCLTTARMADRFGLGAGVSESLQQVFTRWDGKGIPKGVGGTEIVGGVQLFHLADVVEVHHRVAGPSAAVDVARARRGSQFAPAVVDAFCATAGDVLPEADDVIDWDELIDGEPELQQPLRDDDIDAALEAVADFTDLRSPSRTGHSRGVAALAARAGELYGLPPAEVSTLRRAALVHDIGMHGLPATLLEKPGALGATEQERMRMYAYYTHRVLARPPALAQIGAVASLVAERADGSGAPRGLAGNAIPTAGRILAAADAFHAMSEPRPYRPPLDEPQAARELHAEVYAGRLDAGAVEAVLAAAGQRTGKRRTGPAGLTPREMEVLALIARGASTRQVASTLGIAPKTASTHIERIYTKIGASSRSTAALFAMQHGLLDSLQPVDL
jgi:HD-GYP domain-containing protein (c-di-GMP phosphodiesterase class II)